MNRFIFIIFSLFVLSISSVFGQSSMLQSDLERAFRNYELVKLDNQVVLQLLQVVRDHLKVYLVIYY